jgi:hypothetical protein
VSTPTLGSMCPPQAEAEVGPTMTEKAKMVCAPSPVTTPPPKPASAGPLPTEEMRHQGGASPSRLPPGVPVISLGHTRPPGATMATTELSALRPPLLHLSALGTAPPTLALHYHPHPYLNRSVESGDWGCWRLGARVLAHKAFVTHNPLQRLHWAGRTFQPLS